MFTIIAKYVNVLVFDCIAPICGLLCISIPANNANRDESINIFIPCLLISCSFNSKLSVFFELIDMTHYNLSTINKIKNCLFPQHID